MPIWIYEVKMNRTLMVTLKATVAQEECHLYAGPNGLRESNPLRP